MKRISALDGLRGLAIALVLAHHLLGFTQGWIGVDIFFVLSGYLITSILLKERTETHFWKIFYTRRITRIMPAFILLLLCATLTETVSWHVLWPYLLFFGANVATVTQDPIMSANGLYILWSLAVEEHFYFIWPAQVRRFSPKTLSILLAALVLFSPLARALTILRGADWTLTYYLTPFRLDGLALGSLLALGLSNQDTRERIGKAVKFTLPIVSLAFVASLPVMDVRVDVLFCNAAGFTLVSLLTAAILAHLASLPESLLARTLSWSPLVFLGRISYGLYLCHPLVNVLFKRFAKAHGFLHNRALVTIPLCVLISWLSFRFFESRFLTWGRRRVGAYREEDAVVSQSIA